MDYSLPGSSNQQTLHARMLGDPMNCGPPTPGSSVHEILQRRILGWVAISFSRGSSWSRDQTQISYITGWFFTLSHEGSPVSYRRTCHFLDFTLLCFPAFWWVQEKLWFALSKVFFYYGGSITLSSFINPKQKWNKLSLMVRFLFVF